jgi:hypothetical protein
LRAEPLAQRVPHDEPLELAGELPVPSELEIGVDLPRQRVDMQVLETDDLLTGEGLEREVGERLPRQS